MKVAVVGAGIAGLAAAWELTGAGAEVTVYEPGRLGGKLVTSEFMGRPVDEGPDAFLARVPEGVALCEELGLAGDLVAPAASEALIWSGGHLRPLPRGLVLGVPARLWPLARSELLSPRGLARAALEPLLPPTPLGDDESTWELVAARFGDEVADKLVEPLVGSVNAGPTRRLSAAATAPQLLAAAKSARSLLLALRRRAGAPAGPAFFAPRSGMQAIADRLVERLTERGVHFVALEVSALGLADRSVVVEPVGEAYDGTVLAAPAPVTARLLGTLGVDASALAQMEWASVAIITLGMPEGALDVPEGASGLLVHGAGGAPAPASARSLGWGAQAGQEHGAGGAPAPASGLLMTACSFANNKWPHWAAPGVAVLRISVGRADDRRWEELADEELVERALQDACRALGRRAPAPSPLAWRVSRWPSALPQYPVGHLQRVAELRASLSRLALPVGLAGASYGRVGVPACIASGRQAARTVLAALPLRARPGG